MGLLLVTAPTLEPVTLPEAKLHVRELSDDQDSLIENLIKAAREEAEAYTGRAFCTQTWKLTRRNFPCEFVLPNPPLVSVTHVKYYDADGTLQTIDSSDYRVTATSEPGCIEPAYGEAWPTPRDISEAVEVQYVAGYSGTAATSVTNTPQGIKHAILLMVGEWYEHRENASAMNLKEISLAARRMLEKYRIGRHVAWAGLEN